MTDNIPEKLKRDLAIDAACHALIRVHCPTITSAEIQKRSRTESGTGYWTAILDEQPIATINLDGPNRFTFTIAP